MSNEMKGKLADASLDELSRELRERGWRIIPLEMAGALVSGLSTGWWPATDKGKSGHE